MSNIIYEAPMPRYIIMCDGELFEAYNNRRNAFDRAAECKMRQPESQWTVEDSGSAPERTKALRKRVEELHDEIQSAREEVEGYATLMEGLVENLEDFDQ